ncbi:MAG: dUTPase, partial [bacterium]
MDLFESFGNMKNIVQGQLSQDIDIHKVMASEISGVVDFELWQETVDIQKKFNDLVAAGWNSRTPETSEKFDFWMAILDETVEVLGSRHWKWWKKGKDVGEVDWDNVRVELVDLFHFILSICIQHDSETILFQQLVNMEMNNENQKIKDDDFFKDFWD